MGRGFGFFSTKVRAYRFPILIHAEKTLVHSTAPAAPQSKKACKPLSAGPLSIVHAGSISSGRFQALLDHLVYLSERRHLFSGVFPQHMFGNRLFRHHSLHFRNGFNSRSGLHLHDISATTGHGIGHFCHLLARKQAASVLFNFTPEWSFCQLASHLAVDAVSRQKVLCRRLNGQDIQDGKCSVQGNGHQMKRVKPRETVRCTRISQGHRINRSEGESR